MIEVFAVTLPVFLVMGVGYLAALKRWMKPEQIDGLMQFAQAFAIPTLLFSAMAQLDLSTGFNPRLLGSYYTGSIVVFILGIIGARYLFKRAWEDSVVIGFVAMFTNTTLIGLPISSRAFGADNLAPNYAIIALHGAFCYLLGVASLEVARAAGTGLLSVLRKTLYSLTHNPLMIGVGSGLVLNLSGFTLPDPLWDAILIVKSAALPTALVALGGVLHRYRPEGDALTIAMVCLLGLFLHPTLTYSLGQVFALPTEQLRGAVITAASPSGLNAFLFASMAGVGMRIAASSVLIGTLCAIASISFWLWVLP